MVCVALGSSGCTARDDSPPKSAGPGHADPAAEANAEPPKASENSEPTELVRGPAPPAAPPDCPEGTTREGAPPPNGEEAWCERGGKRHGPAVRWGQQGTITELKTYRDGVPHGPSANWLDDGLPVVSGQFKDGHRDGPWITYIEGMRGIVGEMVRGKQHGAFVQYAGNGRKQAVGVFRYGEPCGDFRCWDWQTGEPTGCVPLQGRCPLTDTGGKCPPCNSIVERWDAGPPGGVPIGGPGAGGVP